MSRRTRVAFNDIFQTAMRNEGAWYEELVHSIKRQYEERRVMMGGTSEEMLITHGLLSMY